MKLDLGCGSNPHPGFVGVDICPPAEVIADLRQPWPWPDSSIAYVLAVDIIEHLPSRIDTLNELWRVLEPGSIAEIEVPTIDGECAFADPTHVSFWTRKTFDYFLQGQYYFERYRQSYGIQAVFQVVEEYVRTMRDGPKLLIKLRTVK